MDYAYKYTINELNRSDSNCKLVNGQFIWIIKCLTRIAVGNLGFANLIELRFYALNVLNFFQKRKHFSLEFNQSLKQSIAQKCSINKYHINLFFKFKNRLTNQSILTWSLPIGRRKCKHLAIGQYFEIFWLSFETVQCRHWILALNASAAWA